MKWAGFIILTSLIVFSIVRGGESTPPKQSNVLKDIQDNKGLFLDIHKDIKEINQDFIEIADKTGELIAYTFVDRLIYEVDYLETHIDLYKSKINTLNKRLERGAYHTDECRYQDEGFITDLNMCIEHEANWLHGHWNHGEPMTREQMQDKISEHQAEIDRSLKRIDEAKKEAVELDKKIKAGYRHEGTDELKADIKADMDWNKESKEKGLKSFEKIEKRAVQNGF